MSTVEESIVVDASREDLFRFVDDVDNADRMLPRLAEITDVEERGRGWRRIDFVIDMPGLPAISATSETLDRDPRRMVRTQIEATGAEAVAERRFEPADGGTRLIGTVDYHVDVAALSAVLESPVEPVARRELRGILTSVREAVEQSR